MWTPLSRMETDRDCPFARLFGEEANFRQFPQVPSEALTSGFDRSLLCLLSGGEFETSTELSFSIGLLAGEDMRAILRRSGLSGPPVNIGSTPPQQDCRLLTNFHKMKFCMTFGFLFV